MTVENVELGYWDWTAKITERLTFLRLKTLDHKDISEDDYELLKVLFPIWYNGEYPLFVSKMEGSTPSVTQTNLFNAISSVTGMDNFNGMESDNRTNEPKFKDNETIS